MANRALELLQLISDILKYSDDIDTDDSKETKKPSDIGKSQTVVDYKDSPLRFKGWLR